MAQLVRVSDWNLEDPGLNPGWISMSFLTVGCKGYGLAVDC